MQTNTEETKTVVQSGVQRGVNDSNVIYSTDDTESHGKPHTNLSTGKTASTLSAQSVIEQYVAAKLINADTEYQTHVKTMNALTQSHVATMNVVTTGAVASMQTATNNAQRAIQNAAESAQSAVDLARVSFLDNGQFVDGQNIGAGTAAIKDINDNQSREDIRGKSVDAASDRVATAGESLAQTTARSANSNTAVTDINLANRTLQEVQNLKSVLEGLPAAIAAAVKATS